MRVSARHLVLRHAPGLMAWRWRLAEAVHRGQWPPGDDPDPAVDGPLARHLGDRVARGPFAGMRLSQDAVCSERWPKLVGTYESELHDVVEECIERGYATIVNVGAAEGYYAVGLALRSPGSRVVAVDPLRSARARTRAVAAQNGVAERVEIGARSSCRALNRPLADGGLVVMDCEGAEYGLLDPVRCPNLARSDVLVELHEFVHPSMLAELTARLAPTHTVREIRRQPRRPEMAVLGGLPPGLASRAVDERRPARLRWAFFECRAESPGAMSG